MPAWIQGLGEQLWGEHHLWKVGMPRGELRTAQCWQRMQSCGTGTPANNHSTQLPSWQGVWAGGFVPQLEMCGGSNGEELWELAAQQYTVGRSTGETDRGHCRELNIGIRAPQAKH